MTSEMVATTSESSSAAAAGPSGGKINLLGAITKPFTKMVVQVRKAFRFMKCTIQYKVHVLNQIDKSVLKCWGLGQCQDQRLLKVQCPDETVNSTLIEVSIKIAIGIN
jgi:sodium-dependent phosphate cotransporter